MNSLIYGNAAVKAREHLSLLTKEKLIRLLDVDTTADGVKILTESGYGGGMILARAEDYPELLQKEEEVYIDYVKGIAPKNSGIECMLLKKDYLNIKALLKNRIFASDIKLTSGGVYEVEELMALVEKGESEVLPESLVSLVKSLLEMSDADASDIDIIVDKAYFEDIAARVKKSHSNLLKEYFTLKADGTNLLTMLRAKKAKLNTSKLKALLISGGELKASDLIDAYETDGGILELAKAFKYREMLEDNIGNIVAFEKCLDEALVKILADNKDDMFSLGPIVYYLYAKELELKTVGVILTGVQNNAPKSAIRERVRQIYA